MPAAGWVFGPARLLSFLLSLLAPALVLVLVLALVACTPSSPADPPRRDRTVGPADAVVRAPAGLLLAGPADEGHEESNRTFRVLLDLVRRTPPGARIRIAGNSFSFVPAAEALVEAHERGVRVQVVVDRSVSGEWKAAELLRGALGTDRRKASYVHLAGGQLHQKIWSFTRTAGTRDVVLVGSMNLTYRSAQQYTDVRTWAGRRDVRRALDRQFVRLRGGRPTVPVLPPADLGRDRLWSYPGYDVDTDPVRRQLEAVPAAGARIAVAMYAWLQERGVVLARLLAAKAAAGARVDVVLGRSVGPEVRRVLEGSSVGVHSGAFADGDDIHHKLAVVSHVGADGRRHRFVLTGSDNWTSKSLLRPELLLRVEPDRRTFRRYARWVDALVARSERERRR